MQRLALALTLAALAAPAPAAERFPHLLPSKLQTATTPDLQRTTAQATICSFLSPDGCRLITVVEIDHALLKDERDTFTLTTEESGLRIRASSGVAAVWGFHYYLKRYCDSHVGWQVRNVRLPSPLPTVAETVVASDRFRYYQNACTPSYSFVWWSRPQWEEHVRWMALNGINLAPAPLGHEEVWRRVYLELGLTEDEVAEHLTGPAFLAWLRMGNVRGWAGPLPRSWHERARDSQRAVLELMRNLGMVPVLPAFAGHAPPALARVFPNATFHATQTWNKFGADYCCPLFVDPADPLFRTLGEKFLRASASLNGLSHVYSADPFNELSTDSWSTEFVRRVGDAVFATMHSVDSEAVWLLQNWMFVHDPLLWPRERVRGFLQAVPRGRVLLLDLQSEQWPQYDYYDMYYGQPFVWCMLHNFGGTLGMFGNVDAINREVHAARARDNSTMLGVGLTMEGINQNYVVYDLMLEAGWRRRPVADLDEWTAAYARRRYGCGDGTARGWRYLLRSVYSFRGLNRMRGKYVVTHRPSLGIAPWAWYGSRHLLEAWREFVGAIGECFGSDAFLHDLTDVTRQALQYRAEQLYVRAAAALRPGGGGSWVAREAIGAFLEAMDDMEEILATRAGFSLWPWMEAARAAAGDDPAVRELYELNARNQITLWGPNGEIGDYACKQWAGMLRHYYTPRWRMFFEAALAARGGRFDERAVQEAVQDAAERLFAQEHGAEPPPPGPPNNTITVALRLLGKWAVLAGAQDLPLNVLYAPEGRRVTLPDTEEASLALWSQPPSVRALRSTTPLV